MDVRRRTVDHRRFSSGYPRVPAWLTVSGQGNRYSLSVESAYAWAATHWVTSRSECLIGNSPPMASIYGAWALLFLGVGGGELTLLEGHI